MQEKSAIQQGWDFSARLAGADRAARISSEYIGRVEQAIDQLAVDVVKLKSRQTDAVLGGYIAEQWHADTFNVNAVAAESAHRAFALESNEYASVDIGTNFGKNYSSKYMATPEKSAVAQGVLSPETKVAKYHDQERLIPTNHMKGAAKEASRRAIKNADTRPEVAAAYRDTKEHLTDVVSNGEGIESVPLSKEDNLEMARRVKQDKFDPNDFGVSVNSAVKTEYILRKAAQAGTTAAVITLAMQIAPEIYKSIAYLIKTGRIDIQHLKKTGVKALSASAEGFLRGSISCSVLIMCEKGLLGEAFKGADPTIIGTVVAVLLETVKNSIMVAAGKMTAKEMGTAFADSLVVSAGYVAGAKIGGIIGQALGFDLPIIGYMIGSLVGCAFSAAYNFGKNKLISFCADTGFTCFGLVEQNYELPEEVLAQMGIKTIKVPRTEVPQTAIKKTDVSTTKVKQSQVETVNFSLVRRGVIGVNKVGYIV